MADQLDIFGLYDGVPNTPMLMVEAACAWVAKDYPQPGCRWFKLVNLCEAAARRGEKCVRRGDIYRMAQEAGMSISACEEFRFDNNIWAPLSRLLLMYRPSLAAVIHPRANSIDRAGIDLIAIWHRDVQAETHFPVTSWQEAVEAYRDEDVCAA